MTRSWHMLALSGLLNTLPHLSTSDRRQGTSHTARHALPHTAVLQQWGTLQPRPCEGHEVSRLCSKNLLHDLLPYRTHNSRHGLPPRAKVKKMRSWSGTHNRRKCDSKKNRQTYRDHAKCLCTCLGAQRHVCKQHPQSTTSPHQAHVLHLRVSAGHAGSTYDA